MTKPSPTGMRAPRCAGPGRSASGRVRLLAAAEQLLATRGLGVPNREIVVAAGQRNQSAITYHFGSRAGLIAAVREQHETPVAQHRQHLIARLPGPEVRTTRRLVEAHVQPLAAEMLRCAPSYWARLSEMLLADQPLRFGRGTGSSGLPSGGGSSGGGLSGGGTSGGRSFAGGSSGGGSSVAGASVAGLSAQARPRQRSNATAPELFELMVAHLRHLPEPEAAGRVELTIRFLDNGLARWERDSQASTVGVVDGVARGAGASVVDEMAGWVAGGVTPLATFTLILTDLAVAMLNAPSSAPPQPDVRLPYPPLADASLPHSRLAAHQTLRPAGRRALPRAHPSRGRTKDRPG